MKARYYVKQETNVSVLDAGHESEKKAIEQAEFLCKKYNKNYQVLALHGTAKPKTTTTEFITIKDEE